MIIGATGECMQQVQLANLITKLVQRLARSLEIKQANLTRVSV